MASDFNKSGDSSNPCVAVRDQLERSLETAEEDRYNAVRQHLIDAVQGIRPKDWERPGRLSAAVKLPRHWLGIMLASGSHDKEIRLWNTTTRESVRTLTGHDKQVASVAFSPDGSMFASGSYDTKIRLWNTNTGESVRTLTGHSDCVNSVAFYANGELAMTEEGHRSLGKLKHELDEGGFSLCVTGGSLSVSWNGYKA